MDKKNLAWIIPICLLIGYTLGYFDMGRYYKSCQFSLDIEEGQNDNLKASLLGEKRFACINWEDQEYCESWYIFELNESCFDHWDCDFIGVGKTNNGK